ncbi:MAG TPA: pirin family protein [Bacteroidia bacterium]|nr:pirin family protein [Bacteroidia bacterium]
MPSPKQIEQVFSRPARYNMVGDGFRVYNYFPGAYPVRERVSPFLMLDFNPEFDFGPSARPRGVDVHPHKGFETVTIAYKGHVAHHDSRGNSGVIHPGDVQWMTAGAGILHKEYHEEAFSKKGGAFEMVQLWVNLPAKFKNSPASYQGISAADMAVYTIPQNGGEVRVIAGAFKNLKGPAKTFSPVNLYDMRLNAGAELNFDLPAHYNCSILVVNGEGSVNTHTFKAHDLVLFSNTGESIEIHANASCVLLLMAGEPIAEPIAQYGPFVMNTMQEIQEAIEDFQSGKFGHLE